MSIAVEALFTTALGLQAPWVVSNVELNTDKRRIDFEVKCDANKLPCPACGVAGQGVHDRIKRSWRHLDFFQFVEAMNGMLQQTKTAARGFRTIANFMAIAYLRMAKLKHLPSNPLRPAVSREYGVTRHFARGQFPYETA